MRGRVRNSERQSQEEREVGSGREGGGERKIKEDWAVA